MTSFQIKIKPTSGGPNIVVQTDKTKRIADVKEAVATEASIPATEQRLIYKGQVLKDDRTVESYGEPENLSQRVQRCTSLIHFHKF